MRTSAREQVRLETRRHGIVLAGSFLRSLAIAAPGVALVMLGWPWSAGGIVLTAIAAFAAVRAVWRWDRTRIVLTSDKLYIVHGLLRRSAAAVRIANVGAVEIEQTFPGRILGYGTLTAGELELTFVPHPGELYGLIAQLDG
jgi:membrane protein YdbS with pleckstrin-like domain